MRTWRHIASLSVSFLIACPALAPAQYFGRNKVQYESFDFRVMETAQFDIYYYPREQAAVEQAARMAERWNTRLSTVLQHRLSGRQPLILYANHTDFVQTTAITGTIGEGTGGVTEPLQRRMVLPFTGSLSDTSHVLGHEMVHAFQFDMGHERLQQLPLWMIEGMAEYLSLGPADTQTAVWLRDALHRNILPGFDDLDDPDYFPYRFGHAAWAYLAGRFGDRVVRDIFLTASSSGDPLRAIEQVTNVPIDDLSRDWHASIARTYAELESASPRGAAVITPRGTGGEMNLGPVLSPDGSRIAFFSEKGLFSIDLFLADARTGRIIRKLTSTATDPHLDAIQFIQSAGTWRPDGQVFAAAMVKSGKPVLRLVDVNSGNTIRDITPDIGGQILHPAWSPDGQTIAFAGVVGGASDIYLYRLDDGAITRLTNDLYTDLEPAWSPDGRTIAWVTDRFTTTLDTLDFGPTQLAHIDLASRRVTPLGGYRESQTTNPHFTPDGRALLFVADPNGVPNIHRLPLDSGRPAALTNVGTGVMGISLTSPALSVASDGSLAYSFYVDGAYSIYRLDASAATPLPVTQVRGGDLPPPGPAGNAVVASALADTRTGLPSASAQFAVKPYKPALSLEYVGAAATTAVATNSFGTQVGGGVSLLFSDVLGRHMLGITGQSTGGSVQDIAAQAEYVNQSHRWNWGAMVQRFPWVSVSGAQFVSSVGGTPAIVEQVETVRQINDEFTGLARYPLNRSTRVELSGGVRHIGFTHEVETQAFSLSTGGLLAETKQSLPAGDSLTLGQGGAALVYDTSISGATGPLVGARSRLEITPVVGTIAFAEVLADYRQYVMPFRPFTIAVRGMHFGRYGSGSESNRLSPLYLGYPSLVRGYDVNSFDANECIADGVSACPAFDRLVGSRLLVGNIELRAPLVGMFTGELDYGGLPVEAFAFTDAGVAWTSATRPSFFGGARDLVRSAGGGLRVNLFGYAIVEVTAARPFDRQDDRWRFVFALQPGF